MTFLAQLPPGLRDIRVPFAVGVLWVSAIALIIPLAPKSVQSGGTAALAQDRVIIDVVPHSVLLGLAPLGIYILGVLMNEIRVILGRMLSGFCLAAFTSWGGEDF